jgi:hypothetical protein
MAKNNSFKSFAQLGQIKPTEPEPARGQSPVIAQFDELAYHKTAPTVDAAGEDLGDVSEPKETIATVTSVRREGSTIIVETGDADAPPQVEDERENEDQGGLNDDLDSDFPGGDDDFAGTHDAGAFDEGDDALSDSDQGTDLTDTPNQDDETDPGADAGEDEDNTTDDDEAAPDLNDLDVRQWTDLELEAYITGTVQFEVYHSRVVEAIAEHRIRHVALSAAWTVAECQQFLASGLEPAKTTTGAWVNDVTRAARREHAWSTQELEAWARGEIEPEGSTLASGLAIELKARLQLALPTVDVAAVIQCYKVKAGLAPPVPAFVAPTPKVAPVVAKAAVVVAPTKVTINQEGLTAMNQSYIENSLAEFHNVMRPGRAVGEVKGGEAQKLLKEVIVYAISLPDGQAAGAAMRALFDHFAANRAEGMIFEDTYAFRFIENMRVTPKEQESHAALLTLFLAYADPMVELREQTDISSLIKGVPTRLQSRVLEFFSKL